MPGNQYFRCLEYWVWEGTCPREESIQHQFRCWSLWRWEQVIHSVSQAQAIFIFVSHVREGRCWPICHGCLYSAMRSFWSRSRNSPKLGIKDGFFTTHKPFSPRPMFYIIREGGRLFDDLRMRKKIMKSCDSSHCYAQYA